MDESGKTYICEKCNSVVGIGQFPICRGNASDHGPWTGAEEPMEEVSDEHLTDDVGEAHFTTRREMVKFMDKNHIQPKKNNPYTSKIARGATGKALFFDLGSK